MRQAIGYLRIYVLFTWYAFKGNFKEYFGWSTILIYIIVNAVIGSEVWIPLMLGWITGLSYWYGIAASCEAFWLLPGTPFIPLCVGVTIAIKRWMIKRRHKRCLNYL